MNILLTGTRGYRPGFIGNNFLKLYKDKYDIFEYDGDIRNFDMKLSAFDYDMVVHLAALAGVRRSHEIPTEYWDVNVKASQLIFKQCEEARIPIIYASSSSIYEWWLSPYASTKWFMECIAPPDALGLRFHTVYGPNSRTDMLYDKLLKREVEYITDHVRDWTHVEDVCSAIDVCIQNFQDMKHLVAIDVGTGDPVTVKQLADKVWPDNNLPIRKVTGERTITCADPSVLKEFGWEPKHHILCG
jgi:UDP-glucuronate 4-epimerase